MVKDIAINAVYQDSISGQVISDAVVSGLLALQRFCFARALCHGEELSHSLHAWAIVFFATTKLQTKLQPTSYLSTKLI